jgi:YkoY family integral membrane protein
MFGQTFEPHDLLLIGLLVVLEGVLSIDNALVLGLLARKLPRSQQRRALTYGLVGAFVFRVIAIALAAYLFRWRVVKLVGGAYLVYVSIKHFFFEAKHPHGEQVQIGPDGVPVLHDEATGGVLPYESPAGVAIEGTRKHPGFWSTVAVIELTDIAFAIDSILAAIALVGTPAGYDPSDSHPKLWVVITGGMLGVILMRFAAVLFIKLLDRFPRFETAAYLLVILIGLKLIADWHFNPDPQHPNPMVDFHSTRSLGFWLFWGLMLACFLVGFLPKRRAGGGFPVVPADAKRPEPERAAP